MGLYNIPLKNFGTKVSIKELPEDIAAKVSEENTLHLAHHHSNDEVVSMVLCGRVVRRETLFEEAPRSQFCITCLEKLNEHMEDYMYDEENGKYYDPTGE